MTFTRSQIDVQNLVHQIQKSNDVETIKSHNITLETINAGDGDGKTLFFWACQEGKLEIAEYFMDMNCNINKTDLYGNSPLHQACEKGHLPIVHMLLSNCCRVNVQNSKKQSPLHMAADKGFTKIVELLLDYHINSRFFKYVSLDEEIDMNISDDRGQTALIKSILQGNIEVSRLLVENDCDVNKSDNESKTALHYSLFEGKDEIAIFLVLYGADINAKSKTGDTPIEFANSKLRKSLVDIYNEISGRNDEIAKNAHQTALVSSFALSQ